MKMRLTHNNSQQQINVNNVNDNNVNGNITNVNANVNAKSNANSNISNINANSNVSAKDNNIPYNLNSQNFNQNIEQVKTSPNQLNGLPNRMTMSSVKIANLRIKEFSICFVCSLFPSWSTEMYLEDLGSGIINYSQE